VLAILVGCARTEPDPSSTIELSQEAMAHESWDVNLQISEDGVIRLTLDAAHMVRYEDPDSVYTFFEKDGQASRVTAAFFDSLGAATGTLSSEYVLFDEAEHTMIANGDVVLESARGRRLESEQILWNEESGSIQAPGFVSLTTEDQNIRGYELEATEDLSTWKIKRPTGTVRIRDL
jgi:hypothetical protein